ncbi:hypothetical protein OROMI_016455 [Orobanche minor]
MAKLRHGNSTMVGPDDISESVTSSTTENVKQAMLEGMADYIQSGGTCPNEFAVGLHKEFQALKGHDDIGQFPGLRVRDRELKDSFILEENEKRKRKLEWTPEFLEGAGFRNHLKILRESHVIFFSLRERCVIVRKWYQKEERFVKLSDDEVIVRKWDQKEEHFVKLSDDEVSCFESVIFS